MNHSILRVILTGLLLATPLRVEVLATEGELIVPSQSSQSVTLKLVGGRADEESIDASKLLQVFVGTCESWHPEKPAIVGSYEADGRSVTFIPRFGFVAGQDHVIKVRQRKGGHTLTAFNIPLGNPAVTPEITGVFPSGDSLPENVLRFYIHFSVPMRPHVAFDYIKLVDASGRIDDSAFMKFKQELWSADRKRLTVLIDPGRIKRNVSTNLRLGPALRNGESYRLVVEGGWPTANGAESLASFSKPFSVTTALRELPKTDVWETSVPELRTKDALRIKLDRPFDHQLLQTDIKLFSLTGEEIHGQCSVGKDETEWLFQPSDAWVNERIHIVVDSELEDVAGNNFRELLDHSLDAETRKSSPIQISIDLNDSGTSTKIPLGNRRLFTKELKHDER